jgi:uncharacterized protein YfaS (alpha-2-macroglobulin family)
MKRTAFVIALLALLIPCRLQAQQQASVELFSPQGTVKDIRQVRARFSEAMVPFGDPRAITSPFLIQCPYRGTARWADSRNWIYDFDEDLPAGAECEFILTLGLRTLSGKEIRGQNRFMFSTGGPKIISSQPYQGSQQVNEDQVFILTLDGDATEKSIFDHAYFIVEGLAARVGIRIIQDEEREALINAAYSYYDKDTKEKFLENKARYPLIQAKQLFPSGSEIYLVWGQGILSESGVAGESDQVLPFKVRIPFTASFSCMRENYEADCVPISDMGLVFSAPVPWGAVSGAVLKDTEGRSWTPQHPAEDEGEREEDHLITRIEFKGPFPELSSFALDIPSGIQDESGRDLENAGKFPLSVRTDEYPPLAKFAADFGILELKADPMLPVTLRNVEPELSARMLQIENSESNVVRSDGSPDRLDAAGNISGALLKIPFRKPHEMLSWIERIQTRVGNFRDQSIFSLTSPAQLQNFTIPKIQGAKAFEVIGIPLKEPGFYVVEIKSEILGASLFGESKPAYVSTTVLVTDLAVHFKWGEDASLVWVTTLNSAEPVNGADVNIQDCSGNTLWQGITDRDGIARVLGLAPVGQFDTRCGNGRYSRGLLVSARTEDDMAFVHTSWDDGIESWRFRLPTDWRRDNSIAHTIFDRTLFRAGETVHMKHILRKQTTGGISLLDKAEVGSSMTIRHTGSDQEYVIPLTWDSRGVAEATWDIPQDAKLGNYIVLLAKSKGSEFFPSSGSFTVQEYRVPLMKGSIRPPADPLVAASAVSLDLMVNYLAGGGAGNLPVRFRYDIREKYATTFPDFDGFSFSTGKVREGLYRNESEHPDGAQLEISSVDLTLDKSGAVRHSITDLPAVEKPMDILAELEFRDPNGEVQTVSSRFPLLPADRHVGIKPDSWAASKDTLKFQVAVVDLEGRPLAGASVKVDMLERKNYSYRKRLVGGFYAYEHMTETKNVGRLCEGKTDKTGRLFCDEPSPRSGNVILQAVVEDSKGREIATHRDVWVVGEDSWWFNVEDEDRMDVIPEEKQYEPGEKAKLQVRMPFREATALVSVEREGVGETYVQKLSGNAPVIEVPVKGYYAPNIFISVLAVRGRIGDVQPTAIVDLGRPAWKLGIAEINVGWKAHELKVKVDTDRPAYKVREKAKVSIAVTTADGKLPPQGGEVSVAAVDEGLLELKENDSWKLLDAMMGRRAYSVETSTAQMYVIGKRHFGLKALPQGGGGGRQITRELFNTLLLWKGRVRLDERGRASVEVPLNDSLTSFRIVAVANAAQDLFGTGSTVIRSTQDLIIFSGIAPVVREGDICRSEFTLRNTTEQKLEVEISAGIREISEALKIQRVSLAPGESKTVGWDISVPSNVDSLQYELEAHAVDGAVAGNGIRDRMRVTQKVVPAVPVHAYQSTLEQLDGNLRMEVGRPADAVPGKGGIEVALQPTLLKGISGVTRYMEEYPYTCLEQKVSKSIVTRDIETWNSVMAGLPSYFDSDGLVKYFPTMRYGSEVLTSYLLAIAHESGWSIPDNHKNRMLAGLRGFVEGRVLRHSSLPTADLSIRKIAAVEALSRYRDEIPPARGIRRNLRIQASQGNVIEDLLSAITIEPNLWPTSAVIDWANILMRTPGIADRYKKYTEADQILRSRLNFQGTTMGFSTEEGDCLWWLMVSIDSNALRLLLSRMDSPEWETDIPRIVKGVLGRQKKGRWITTTANAWGVLAMEEFSKLFENVPVTGNTMAALGGETRTVDWSASTEGETLSLGWPDGRKPLEVTMDGTGKPWTTVTSFAAIPLKEPLSTGFRIKKSYEAIERRQQGVWSCGDIVRVRLEIDSQSDMTWVVVEDPIPAGASILGTGLGRDSQLLTEGEESRGWVWPAYEERSFEAFRAYYEYVPKGSWTIEYTMRLNNEGVMNLPNTRVEALYAPEMFGEIPNEAMRIQPQIPSGD